MTKKEKLLQEILENNPDLINQKESIIELIDILINNNPKIEIDEQFKNNLKNKINSIILNDDKIIKKLSLYTIFINFMSVAFIFAGIYYSTNNISFFTKNDDGKKVNINQIENRLRNVNDNNNENIQNVDTQIIDLIQDNSLIENSSNIRSLKEPMIQNQMINMDEGIENNTLLLEDSLELEDSIDNLGENIESNDKNFDQFCFDNYGDILNINGIKMCVLDSKVCIESEYNNNSCNFLEIK